MLIMPATERPFAAMAEDIAKRFFAGGSASLNELVAEAAVKAQMVPEEVKRLVEKTNTAASIAFLSSNEDKKGSFDLAEYDEVLKRTHPTEDEDDAEPEEENEETSDDKEEASSGDSEKLACCLDELVGKRAVLKKQASSGPAVSEAPAALKAAEQYRMAKTASDAYGKLLTVHREASRARLEKVAEEAAVKADLDWIISEFNRWKGPDFNKFASEAVALHGDAAKPVINGIASYLGVKARLGKTAAYIDDSTEAHRKMASVLTHLDNLSVLGRGIERMDEAEKHFRKQALEAAAR